MATRQCRDAASRVSTGNYFQIRFRVERACECRHTGPRQWSLRRLARKLFHGRSSSELLDHAIEIGIARAKAPCQPIPTAVGNPLAISDNLELTGLPRRNDGFNVEALLDEGHETRDLGLVVLSRWAVNDLDLHPDPQSASKRKSK